MSFSDLSSREINHPATAPGENLNLEIVGDGAFTTADMTLSVGPAHPATHGVLRVVLEMDGERVTSAHPVIGYMHRGFEKLAEHRDFRQNLALVNRHDWLSGMTNEMGLAMTVERMLEMEVPERAQWIRMLCAEYNRILNHLLFVGSYGLELGAITPMFYATRERERIQYLLESATGGRLHYTYSQPGGVKIDLPKGFLQQSVELVPDLRKRIQDLEDLLLGNEIFMARTKGVGPLPTEVALSYGVSGPTLQATGIAEDVRVTEPYLRYDQVEVPVPVGENGDSWDRFYCLLGRMKASLHIIEQIHDHIPAGPVNVKLPKMVKAPEGSTYVRVENPLGSLGYWLESDGGRTPWRLKMRTASFSNVQMLPYLLVGTLMPDTVSILGSVFFVVGDVDQMMFDTVLTTSSALVAQTAGLLDTDSFVLSVALKAVVVIGLFLSLPLVVGYMEHKAMARLQHRRGPMFAGPAGSLQLVADGIKFIQKEDVIPRAADKWVFAIAPGMALVPAMLIFFVLPLGPGIWAQDLDLGLFYALAITSISVLGVMMGGWASANKFSLIGGLRAAAQLIAYELPLILAAIAVAVQAGSLSLVGIVESQATFMVGGSDINVWFVFPQLLGFGIFFLAALAELSRPPFDMPIADSELVFGYMTEYTGMKFAMYLLTEYAGMVSMSALMVVLYLGGWQILPGVPLPGCEAGGGLFDCGVLGTLIGFGVVVGKILLLTFVMVWARVAYPRLREDQLQRMSWLVLVPLSLFNLAVVAVAKVVL